MANEEHLRVLKRGVAAWNSWRARRKVRPNLHEADLREADLRGADLIGARLIGANLVGATLRKANLFRADLRRANLREADLHGADLHEADLREAGLNRVRLPFANFQDALVSEAVLSWTVLSWADFRRADLHRVNLVRADLRGADLRLANLQQARLEHAYLGGAHLQEAKLSEADLRGADLTDTDCSNADLRGAYLQYATLVRTNLEGSTLTDCKVYGVSAWDLKLSEETDQLNLLVSPFSGSQSSETSITVDDIEVAQFVYLLLNNEKLRNVIETMSSKAVLILGRFTPERKAMLEAIRQKLRDLGYLPIMFDFARPSSRDLTETVSILAHLSRFIVADITNPSSIPKELEAVVPAIAIPVAPLIAASDKPYAMIRDYWKFHWVLESYHYEDLEDLLASFEDEVVAPAEAKFVELERARVAALGE